MSYANGQQLGTKHQEMEKLIDFYSREIVFLQQLLSEVISKNTSHEATSDAEHFQNQFLIQLKNIDECRLKIKNNKHLAFLDIKDHAGKIDNRIANDLNNIVQEVLGMEKIISELRHQYKSYLLKWM
jgi:hypothetical protein